MARSRPAAPSEQTPLLDARAPGSHGTSNAYRATQQPVVGDGQIQETQLSHPPHADGGNGQQPGAKLAQGASVRQIAPDLLRGALMVFMALDHVSVSTSAYPHGTNGADGEKTTTEVVVWSSNLAYALRTLTHLCAPGFGMLLGMGVAFFMASRAKQGWSLKELTMHYAKRMVAIIVVNEVAFLPVIIPTGIWLFNAVLWALAIDYFIVGMLAMALSHVVEPALVRLWPTSKQSARASRIEVDGEEAAVNSGAQQTSEEHARRAAFYIANLSLLVLSFVSLWWNIWLEDSKGDCDLHRHQQMHPLAFPDIPESSHCSVDARLIYEFFFHRGTYMANGLKMMCKPRLIHLLLHLDNSSDVCEDRSFLWLSSDGVAFVLHLWTALWAPASGQPGQKGNGDIACFPRKALCCGLVIGDARSFACCRLCFPLCCNSPLQLRQSQHTLPAKCTKSTDTAA